jgi:hypothetical protein
LGYEGLYEISNLGNLVRLSTFGKDPRSVRKPRAKAVKKNGYRYFHMCANGVRKYRSAHIMVWEAFNGPVPDGLELNHKDGVRDNPALLNLEVGTHAENIKHSFVVLGKKSNFRPMLGVSHGASKLKDHDVIRIRELHASGWRRIDIAAEFGITDVNVGHITSRKTWRHI